MKVLVADDETLIRELLATALAGDENEVLVASNGLEALALTRSERPDVIVLDLQMPGLDGYAVLRKLKTSDDLGDIPVVVLSGRGTPENVRLAMASGASDFLVKSGINFGHMCARIARACSHPPAENHEGGSGSLIDGGEPLREQSIGNAESSSANSHLSEDRHSSTKQVSSRGVQPHQIQRHSDTATLRPEQVKAKLEHEIQLRAMPFVAAELADISAGVRVSAAQLAETIARDQALTIRVLKMANSVYYSHLGRAQNLKQAITHIGVRGVHEIAVAAKLVNSYMGDGSSSGLDRLAFWRHSICCGVLARELVALKDGSSEMLEHAFLAGLMHDVGKAVLDDLFGEPYAHVVQLAARKVIPLHQAELEVFGLTHSHVARTLLSRSGFPDSLVDPIVLHHTPVQQLSHSMASGTRTLTNSVRLANILAKAVQIGSGADETLDAITHDLLVACKADRDDIYALLEDLDRKVNEVSLILLMHGGTDPKKDRLRQISERHVWLIREAATEADPVEILLRRSGCEVRSAADDLEEPGEYLPDVVLVKPESPGWVQTLAGRLGATVWSSPSHSPHYVLLVAPPGEPELVDPFRPLGPLSLCRWWAIRDLEQMVLGRSGQ